MVDVNIYLLKVVSRTKADSTQQWGDFPRIPHSHFLFVLVTGPLPGLDSLSYSVIILEPDVPRSHMIYS